MICEKRMLFKNYDVLLQFLEHSMSQMGELWIHWMATQIQSNVSVEGLEALVST